MNWYKKVSLKTLFYSWCLQDTVDIYNTENVNERNICLNDKKLSCFKEGLKII